MSSTSNSGPTKGGPTDDHKGDDMAEIRSQMALLASQVAALAAAMPLPSVAAIATSGVAGAVASPSLIAGIRNAANLLPLASIHAKRASTTAAAPIVGVAPSTPAVTAGIVHHHKTTDDLPTTNELADIGLDGNQDEPSTVARAAALDTRLAPLQCHHIDEEYDGSFVKWSKDGKWKDYYGREVKLMARIADACRRGDHDDVLEMVCRRIAALDLMNNGHGSAAADAIEGKSRTAIVPQQMRIAAVKEGNLMQRTTTTPRDNHGGGPGLGKGKSKGKNGKATGGAASKAAVTSGTK